MKNHKYQLDDWIKELTPGIQTIKEMDSYPKLPEPQSELKNCELFFRSLSK